MATKKRPKRQRQQKKTKTQQSKGDEKDVQNRQKGK